MSFKRSAGKVKRNKALIFLLLPFILAVFLVGWFMYVWGQSRYGVAPKDAKSNNVTIGRMPLEVEVA